VHGEKAVIVVARWRRDRNLRDGGFQPATSELPDPPSGSVGNSWPRVPNRKGAGDTLADAPISEAFGAVRAAAAKALIGGVFARTGPQACRRAGRDS